MLKLDKQETLSNTLKLDAAVKPRKYAFYILLLIALLIAGFLINLFFFKTEEDKVVKFETVPIKRGKLTAEVTATGKLEPVTQVDIGIEVSGTVAEIKADFNSHVTAGQVLAVLDPRLFDARVKQSQGALDQAQARLVDAEATISEKKQALDFMLEARKLSGGSVPAKQDIVTAEANLKRAYANKKSMQALIYQAEGQLKLDQTNLIKSSIKTPIEGVVLDRKIELGQTVAASLQTPVMFTIAKNLTEMELHVDVDEADVGKIKLGQAASFTVDAYPDKKFPAKISEIRYAPKTVGGVVTYETVLLVNNEELFLRPGMTATADMIVSEVKNVLLVPSAALRFSPEKAGDNPKKEPSFLEKLLPRGLKSSSGNPKKMVEKKKSAEKEEPQVWILENNQPQAIKVKVGMSDGEMNEVTAAQLKEGMQVIVDSVSLPK